MKQAIIVVGNVSEGLTFYGPFEGSRQARDYAEREFASYDWHWHVAVIEHPWEAK